MVHNFFRKHDAPTLWWLLCVRVTIQPSQIFSEGEGARSLLFTRFCPFSAECHINISLAWRPLWAQSENRVSSMFTFAPTFDDTAPFKCVMNDVCAIDRSPFKDFKWSVTSVRTYEKCYTRTTIICPVRCAEKHTLLQNSNVRSVLVESLPRTFIHLGDLT